MAHAIDFMPKVAWADLDTATRERIGYKVVGDLIATRIPTEVIYLLEAVRLRNFDIPVDVIEKTYQIDFDGLFAEFDDDYMLSVPQEPCDDEDDDIDPLEVFTFYICNREIAQRDKELLTNCGVSIVEYADLYIFRRTIFGQLIASDYNMEKYAEALYNKGWVHL